MQRIYETSVPQVKILYQNTTHLQNEREREQEKERDGVEPRIPQNSSFSIITSESKRQGRYPE